MPNNLASLLYEIGQWFGIIGFLFLSSLISLGDIARFLDRFFGLDKIIKFERKFAIFTAIFVLFHPIFFILSDQKILYYITPNFSIIPLSLGIISAYIFIVVMISSIIYKRISYTAWQYIHVLTYLLFGFILYHAFYWGSDSSEIGMKILYGTLLIAILIGAIYRTQYKIRQRYSNKFFVKNISWDITDTFTLTLSPQNKFYFHAGQFCFLRINKDKLYARHPFTISSSPDERDLKFTIKNTGRFTKIASELEIGEQIFVDGPFGTFTIHNSDSAKNLVFIAGGVGITPFLSILKNQMHFNKTQNITLIYCCKKENDIISRNFFDSINKRWFKLIYILSQSKYSHAINYKCGHITKKTIEESAVDMNNSLFYICGPEGLKNSVTKILRELKIKKQNIYIEDFFW